MHIIYIIIIYITIYIYICMAFSLNYWMRNRKVIAVSYKRYECREEVFPLKLSSLDFQIVQEKWRISERAVSPVGVKCERVWEHLNGGWIPVFSLVQSARHGTNMAGAIIYAPHLHVRDFCQGCPRTWIRAAYGKTGRCCVAAFCIFLNASIRFKWQVRLNGAFVCFEKFRGLRTIFYKKKKKTLLYIRHSTLLEIDRYKSGFSGFYCAAIICRVNWIKICVRY